MACSPDSRGHEVERLEILPLIDWHSEEHRLSTEAGVSYLLRADGHCLLMDFGLNRKRAHPSPLLSNMRALDIRFEDIDAAVITHLHLDHVGGLKAQRAHTFAPSAEAVDLPPGWPVYAPARMHHPSAKIVEVNETCSVLEVFTLLSPLSRKLFLMGTVQEVSLVVVVKGFGPVLIVGCGHPTVPRLIEHCRRELGEGPKAIVGGLHFPVDGSRLNLLGIPLQKYLGIGPRPWPPLRREDVRLTATHMRDQGVRRLALSGHDSSDTAIVEFRTAFGEGFEVVHVGRPIVFHA